MPRRRASTPKTRRFPIIRISGASIARTRRRSPQKRARLLRRIIYAESSNHHAAARRIDGRSDDCRDQGQAGRQRSSADQEIIEVETDKAVMGVTTPCAGRDREDRCGSEGNVCGRRGARLCRGERSGRGAIPEAGAARAAGRRGRGNSRRERIGKSKKRKRLAFPESMKAAVAASRGSHPRRRAEWWSARSRRHEGRRLSFAARSRAHGRVAIDAGRSRGNRGKRHAAVSRSKIWKIICAELKRRRRAKPSAIRTGVADAMRRSWTRPLATVGFSVCLDPVLQDRKKRDPKPGPALYALRALALALAEKPAAAARLIGGRAFCSNRSTSASRSKRRTASWFRSFATPTRLRSLT